MDMVETGYATNLSSRRKKRTMLFQPRGMKGTIHIFRHGKPICGTNAKPQRGPFDLTHDEIMRGRVQKGWSLHLSVCGHCQKKYAKEHREGRARSTGDRIGRVQDAVGRLTKILNRNR